VSAKTAKKVAGTLTSIRRLLVFPGSSSLGWSIVDDRGDIDSLLASCANILSSSFTDNHTEKGKTTR
jgi:hypothetical protein